MKLVKMLKNNFIQINCPSMSLHCAKMMPSSIADTSLILSNTSNTTTSMFYTASNQQTTSKMQTRLASLRRRRSTKMVRFSLDESRSMATNSKQQRICLSKPFNRRKTLSKRKSATIIIKRIDRSKPSEAPNTSCKLYEQTKFQIPTIASTANQVTRKTQPSMGIRAVSLKMQQQKQETIVPKTSAPFLENGSPNSSTKLNSSVSFTFEPYSNPLMPPKPITTVNKPTKLFKKNSKYNKRMSLNQKQLQGFSTLALKINQHNQLNQTSKVLLSNDQMVFSTCVISTYV